MTSYSNVEAIQETRCRREQINNNAFMPNYPSEPRIYARQWQQMTMRGREDDPAIPDSDSTVPIKP